MTLVGLLAALTVARCLAQAAEDSSILRQPAALSPANDPAETGEEPIFERLPSIDPPVSVPPSQNPSPPAGESLVIGPAITLEGSAKAPPVVSLCDFVGYRYATGSLEWIPGGGDQFGMFSINWDHYQKPGVNNGIDVGLGFHFLSGPDQTDMPPRTYDFSLGYQARDRLGPFGFDVAAAVLAASDFVGSARKGILFPSHAVGFLSVRPAMDVVFGVDYLDRGDIKLLPVAGLIWTPNPEMRFEVVFPRPRAVFQLTDSYRLYLSGELGGGTWAIERVALGNDLATYRDLRTCIGIERVEEDGQWSAFEIGYLFDRRLEYSSGIGDMHLDDAVILRLVTTF